MARFEGHDSRTADKFVMRMKPEQRERLKVRAQAENRSMNDTAVTALDRYLDQGEAFDELLRIVNQAIQPQTGAFVTIKRDYLRTLVLANNGDVPGDDPAMVAAIAILGHDPHMGEP